MSPSIPGGTLASSTWNVGTEARSGGCDPSSWSSTRGRGSPAPRPAAAPAPESGQALQLSPLLLSSDGATVYGVPHTGQLAALPLPGRRNPAEASVSPGRAAMQP